MDDGPICVGRGGDDTIVGVGFLREPNGIGRGGYRPQDASKSDAYENGKRQQPEGLFHGSYYICIIPGGNLRD